ncbi:unnamed protein product, partial [Mesorhabditis belari]|uniref:BHLH domain-containing protein n=1 Tax=Mesorhabditis belari TaxID=2138241 RepID=A0AAF3FBV6_9BILA
MHSIPARRPLPKLSSKVKKAQPTRKVKKMTRLTREEKEELSRLASILPPSLQISNPQAEPTRVLQDTVAYIDELLHLVSTRVNQGTLPREILSQITLPTHLINPSPPQKTRKFEKMK